jgi:hypothetical protein
VWGRRAGPTVPGVALDEPPVVALVPEVSGAWPWNVGTSPDAVPVLAEGWVDDPVGPATRMVTPIAMAAAMLVTLATSRLRWKRR